MPEGVITKAEEVTPEWLTGVLRENGYLERGDVLEVRSLLTKTLEVSAVSRLEICYSLDAPASAPRRLFLKISRPNSSKPDFPDLNRKEIEFYLTLAPELANAPFIRCYDASYSAESDSSHLLLQDLSETHFQPESPQPPLKSYREMAVRALAQLHAHWWEHPGLGVDIGDLFDEAELDTFVHNVEISVRDFVDFLGERLSTEQRRIYDRLVASKHKIWGRLTDAAGLTVTHGDAHWWNVLYPLDPGKHSAYLFDWQLWHVDVGARDLAFMIALGGFAERQAAIEEDLLRYYHGGLLANGVRNFSWEDLWDDYRWAAIRNLNIPVIQWSAGKPQKFWQENLDRAMKAFDDLHCSDLIGK